MTHPVSKNTAVSARTINPPEAAGLQLDAETMSTVFDCLLGVVICPIVIPWPYVFEHYVKKPGDRWRRALREGGNKAGRQQAAH